MRGARSSPLAEWVVARASAAINGVRQAVSPRSLGPSPIHPQPGGAPPPRASMSGGPVEPMRREPWFGPGRPPTPQAPKEDVAGRAFDYQPGTNMASRPRQYSGISFEQLKQLSHSLDVARLCIETRKDQMGSLTWSILPKQRAGQAKRPGLADDRCRQVEDRLQRPDRKHSFTQWMGMLVEQQLTIDAPSVYVRHTMGGDLYALEVIDGALIKPLLDKTGRAPEAPEPAYQQHLKGMAAVNYSVDELIYHPRNVRVDHVYGCSVMEQIVMTVNIAIRREVAKLAYFTEGNIPEAIISVPKAWTPEQVAKFQVTWDALLKMQDQKAGLKFVPGEMTFQTTRSDGMLMGPFDEWLARVICYAFSLPPTAFVQQQNRATAEQANETALQEGLAPMMTWAKGLMDRIVQDVFGFKDLEFTWDDIKQISVAAERVQDLADIQVAVMSVDEARAKRGLDPIGLSHFIMGGPNGVIFVKDLIEAQAAGLTKLQPPPQPGMMPGMALPGLPAPPPMLALPPPSGPNVQQAVAPGAGAPRKSQSDFAEMPAPTPRRQTQQSAAQSGTDPLAGIPANILAAIGLGPQGAGGRASDVTRADEIQTDPTMAHVPSAQVLATLRAVEAMHKRFAPAAGRR